MRVKSGAIEIIFKSHKPFQSYLLTSQADSAKKACLLVIQNEIQALCFNYILHIAYMSFKSGEGGKFGNC
jgi:hypothetical protein